MSGPGDPSRRPTIGFIGLGLMGGPMAANIASVFDTIGFDVASQSGKELGNVRLASDVAAVAAGSEIVFLSLPTPEASLEVTRQVVETPGRKVRIVVETSTIGMQSVSECAAIAGGAGVAYVDAPVSGGVVRARSGELSIVAAGSHDALAEVRPVLEAISSRIFVMGRSRASAR